MAVGGEGSMPSVPFMYKLGLDTAAFEEARTTKKGSIVDLISNWSARDIA